MTFPLLQTLPWKKGRAKRCLLLSGVPKKAGTVPASECFFCGGGTPSAASF